jgi:predicted nucleic acid-binding protein
MIHLDTSVLVEAFSGRTSTAVGLHRAIEAGERVTVSAVALYEWLRGPRRPDELTLRTVVVPDEMIVPFAHAEAALAADLYRSLPRPRARAADLAIAACALTHSAALWTLDPDDFRDVPGLTLFGPPD